jgi:IS30 family transposase
MKPSLLAMIDVKLSLHWSPEQISGWLREDRDQGISHESIYRYVWADKKGGGVLHTRLRRRGRRYQWRGSDGKTSRGQIKNRVSIDERPAIVDAKRQVGHWEIDTVIGKGHSGVLVTIVERVTKFTLACRAISKSAAHVTAATIALLAPLKASVRSITADNGKEFAYHEQIAKRLNCDVYFAHPYCSWERGLNENTNGLLRQDFPKSTDFKQVTDSEVQKVVKRLNDRPRKLLAFKTPAYLMREHMAALAA